MQRSVAQLEGARTHLQTILDNLTAGVIVFDRDGRIDTVNPGATRILRAAAVGLPRPPARRRAAASRTSPHAVAQRFELHRDQPRGRRARPLAGRLRPADPAANGEHDKVTLLVRGARCRTTARLMVFDDITEVVSAQRSAAWSEVARRLAHEIKNPLTPIQLSAERLQHKLEAKLEGHRPGDAACARWRTIVNQVQAMKQLVNEFRDYARLPAARLQPLDLNALVARGAGAVRPGAGARAPARRAGAAACRPSWATPRSCAR